jgi:transcriptional regulator with GAF, ATPase, and Fis domain
MKDRISSLSRELENRDSDGSGFDAVSEITTILAAIPDRTAFLNALLRTARRCFLSNHEAILSYHHPTKRWFVEAAQDLRADALEEIKGLSRTVIERTRDSAASVLVPDTHSDDLTRESRSVRLYNIQSVLTAPIHVNSEMWGLMYLANTSAPHAFDGQSQKQVERFAKFAGMAITRCEEFVRLSLPPLVQGDDAPALLNDVRSSQMAAVLEDLRRAAPTDASILLVGETGTGKDVLANWIHQNSPRRKKPFVQINCAELDPDLIEVELFGVESGVATGVTFREGKMKVADGGTLFLNEIGELPLSVQAKLLRVIEDRVVERVGGRNVLGVDVRYICATNRDLEGLVKSGQFRRDLYHRINVFGVTIPNLGERREDIPQLARDILARICRKLNRPAMRLSDPSLDYLSRRDWKGNIRELANFIERSVILSPGEELIVDDQHPRQVSSGKAERIGRHTSLKRAVDSFEASHIHQALRNSGWVRVRAANRLGIPDSTLRSKMKKHAIKPPRRLP